MGTETLNGVQAFKWDKKGLQSNFYYETTEANPQDRVQLKTMQGTNDFMTFSKDTWET